MTTTFGSGPPRHVRRARCRRLTLNDGGPGIIAGLFAATPEQVNSWDLSGLTPTSWPAVEFKRLEPVKLRTLEAILTERTYDEINQDPPSGVVRNGGANGPWIMPVRQQLVVALAGLTPQSGASAAARWGDTAEFELRPTDLPRPEDVASLTVILGDMADLARMLEPGQSMYLLMA